MMKLEDILTVPITKTYDLNSMSVPDENKSCKAPNTFNLVLSDIFDILKEIFENNDSSKEIKTTDLNCKKDFDLITLSLQGLIDLKFIPFISDSLQNVSDSLNTSLSSNIEASDNTQLMLIFPFERLQLTQSEIDLNKNTISEDKKYFIPVKEIQQQKVSFVIADSDKNDNIIENNALPFLDSKEVKKQNGQDYSAKNVDIPENKSIYDNQAKTEIFHSINAENKNIEILFNDNFNSDQRTLDDNGKDDTIINAIKINDKVLSHNEINKHPDNAIEQHIVKAVKGNDFLEEYKFVITKHDNKSLEISLDPEGLGKIDIELVLDKGILNAQIRVSETGKELIENNLHSILNALTEEGINVGGFSIDLRDGKKGFYSDNRQKDKDENMFTASVPVHIQSGKGLISIIV